MALQFLTHQISMSGRAVQHPLVRRTGLFFLINALRLSHRYMAQDAHNAYKL